MTAKATSDIAIRRARSSGRSRLNTTTPLEAVAMTIALLARSAPTVATSTIAPASAALSRSRFRLFIRESIGFGEGRLTRPRRGPVVVGQRSRPIRVWSSPGEFDVSLRSIAVASAPEGIGESIFDTSPTPELYRVAALDLWRTLGMFATGVTVITTKRGEQVHGMTANASMSVSLRPPLILISVDRRARMNALLHEGATTASACSRNARPASPIASPAGRPAMRRSRCSSSSGNAARAGRPRESRRASRPLATGAATTRCSSGRVEYVRYGDGHAAALPRRPLRALVQEPHVFSGSARRTSCGRSSRPASSALTRDGWG